jgi:hypothetical protein
MDKTHSNSKTSSFRPQNMDKTRQQQQNILIQAAKPGRNCREEKKR